jgi:hypothetical protein
MRNKSGLLSRNDKWRCGTQEDIPSVKELRTKSGSKTIWSIIGFGDAIVKEHVLII